MHVCIYIYIYMHMYVCMYKLYVYVCMHVCMYMCVYMYVYIVSPNACMFSLTIKPLFYDHLRSSWACPMKQHMLIQFSKYIQHRAQLSICLHCWLHFLCHTSTLWHVVSLQSIASPQSAMSKPCQWYIDIFTSHIIQHSCMHTLPWILDDLTFADFHTLLTALAQSLVHQSLHNSAPPIQHHTLACIICECQSLLYRYLVSHLTCTWSLIMSEASLIATCSPVSWSISHAPG